MCCVRSRRLLPMSLGRVCAHGGTNTQHQGELECFNDARTGMPHGIPRGAMCVQRFDDSRNSAIHTTFRISLRSSSMPEPRDPLLKVVISYKRIRGFDAARYKGFWVPPAGRRTCRGNRTEGIGRQRVTAGAAVPPPLLPQRGRATAR